MPSPREGESRRDFVSRCIPIVLEDGNAKGPDQAVAICNSMYKEKKEMKDLLVFEGGAIKALGNGKIGGHLVIFGSPDQLDLEDEFFTADTNFGKHKSTPILYSHGLDENIKGREIGEGTLTPDDVGIWIEAQMELRDKYEEAIYEMVEAGKLGWSSGTAPHRVEREEAEKGFFIKSWPLGLDASLTPAPAEPLNRAVTLKSWADRQSAEDTRSQEGDKVEADLEEKKSRKKKVAAVAVLLSGVHKH